MYVPYRFQNYLDLVLFIDANTNYLFVIDWLIDWLIVYFDVVVFV